MYAEVSLPEVLEEPHQLVLNFPKGSCDQKKRVHSSLQAKWLAAKWYWLHNNEARDIVFCYICVLSQWWTYVVMVS